MTRVKRTGVRTRTLGAGWEERYLAAVRKARAQKLIPEEQAEKLRRLAGAYFCAKCKLEHRTESALGKKHLRLQPAAKAPESSPKTEPLPVKRASRAKRGARPARAKLERKNTGPPCKPMPEQGENRQ